MATQVIPVYSGVQIADTTPSPNSTVLRDNLGGIAGVQVSGSELLTSGIETTAVKSVQTASVTINASAKTWPFDTTSGSLVATLPAVASCAGRRYTFIKTVAGNTLTIAGAGAELINGSNTKVLTAQWSSITIESNGSFWLIIASI